MGLHVVVGAGAVGSSTARLLRAQGHDVRVVSRSGRGPAEVERVALDVSDAAGAGRLAAVAAGADALYNCVNPAYHRWATDWPPVADALLATAERTGAVLVTTANLYGYGRVDAPMTERTPLAATGVKGRVRNAMWEAARAAHEAGRARVTEARASDFYGPGPDDTSHLGRYFTPRLLAGKRPWVLQGDVDAPHSWTFVPDLARTLVTLATDERALGRAWHVPTAPPVSLRGVAAAMAQAAGLPAPEVQVLPRWALRAMGVAVPIARELQEVRHQFERPFVLDSSAAQQTFGLAPTPFAEGIEAHLAFWRQRAAA